MPNRVPPGRCAEADGVEGFPRLLPRAELPPDHALKRCDGSAVPWVPSRPAILSVPRELPISEDLGPLSPPFGENRNVRVEGEPERSELKLRVLGAPGLKPRVLGVLELKLRGLGAPGPKLRGLGALELKPDDGTEPAGGLKEGREGENWNDLPEPRDGPADDGGLKEGPGRLKLGAGLEGADGRKEGPGPLEKPPDPKLCVGEPEPNDGPGRPEKPPPPDPKPGEEKPELADGPGRPENDAPPDV